MDDAVVLAQGAVDAVLDMVHDEFLVILASGETATKRLKNATDLAKKVVPFTARPFKAAETSNKTDVPLWSKHPDPEVCLAVLAATFTRGSDKPEAVRLFVRQALAWDLNRPIDPSVLLS